MKTTAISIEEKVDALLGCLDEDVRNLQQGLSRLDELRRLVIKRDDVALNRLLETIQMEVSDCRRHEHNRQSIRQELAATLGYDLRQMTLSALAAHLPKGRKEQVNRRRAKIKSLIEEFRKEHLGTVLLLSECARFNTLLLRSIFDLGKVEGLTYGSNGAAERQADVALLSLQL